MHAYAKIDRLAGNNRHAGSQPAHPIPIQKIRGDWRCKGLMGIYGGPANQPWEAVLRIKIIRNSIQVTMELGDDRIAFFSQGATIEVTSSGAIRLKYLYSNIENAEASTDDAYFGHSDILFSHDLKGAAGKYFNDEQRGTFGSFELERL
ncbi:hypothetical protein [Aquimonas voraii]|uniref:CD-NTase-associated protein 15 domain-containing protein n=1 Tax=Aquimonas voraii TaxID=265719 RepID=A0A1G6ZBS8_9GAMM|nr:hypothetical protein [Aquimonas voraii]SDD99186.1 hypothetical protein SAMN04488509_1135 [Aquimonas voraii]